MAEWVQTISGDIIPVSGITYIGCNAPGCEEVQKKYMCAVCNNQIFEIFDLVDQYENANGVKFRRISDWDHELACIVLDAILNYDEKIFRCNEHDDELFNRMVEVLELDG